MRIGIVTMWNALDNYGGILQTYALQRYLRNLGIEAFDIRFINRPLFKNRAKVFIRHCLEFVHLMKRNEVEQKREIARSKYGLRRFKEFRDNHINFSETIYYSMHQITNNPPMADVFITGSDQVWGRVIEGGSPMERVNFLDFGNSTSKKVAYAASFGHDYFPCGDKQLFHDLVSKFSAVSVRENIGINFCKECGIEAVRCVDSTLLLNADDYYSIITERKHAYRYAYFYTANVRSPKEIYWFELSEYFKSNGIKPVVTTASGYIPAEEVFEGAIYDYASPQEWLTNVKHSEIVITSSFHGIVFSILFQKDFIYLPLSGKQGSGNNRIIDLLETCRLEDRIAYSYENAKQLISRPIDYSHLAYTELDKLIDNSKAFLAKAIFN